MTSKVRTKGVIMRLRQLLQRGFEEGEEPINGSSATWGKTVVDSHGECVRPCLVGRKFSVFSIQIFLKQGKRV